MNVARLLADTVAARPDAPALIDRHRGRDRVTSFAALDLSARRLARLLRESGLRPGDGVLLFHPPTLELYTTLIALFRLGAVAMVVDPSAGRALLDVACAMYPPRALLASPMAHLLRLVAPALRRVPLKLSSVPWVPGALHLGRAGALAPDDAIAPCDAETPALLTFTSGSTGQPKGAVRTHGVLLAQHRALADGVAAGAGDTDLGNLPIVVLTNLAAGATSILPDADLRRPGAIDAAPVVRQLREHRATRLTASPAFLERLAHYCEGRRESLDALRTVVTGGGPVFPDIVARLRRMAPAARVVSVYGSTEAEPIAHVSHEETAPEDLAAMRGGAGLLAGHPAPVVRLRILRAQWGTPIEPLTSVEMEARTLPTGEAGEIVVAGAHVLKGYLHGRGDEETKFRVDGEVWHRTGDLGYLDARGRLWLLGRASARIADEHGVLYPFALECAAREAFGVRAAAAVRHRGRRVLVVEPHAARPLPPPERMRDAMAWARLDAVVTCRALPLDRRHNSKVDYPRVLRLLDDEPALRTWSGSGSG